jgi:aminomethyltransferase
MTASWRFSSLADRHIALGSKLEDWSGMGTAWSYAKDADAEYMAVRTKAGLMDVSGLKKIHLNGPHASHLLDRVTTRNVEKLAPGRSVYCSMLDERGKFIDDGIIYRFGPNSFMVVHGSGAGHETLVAGSTGKDVSIRFDDNLHDLSLQGPLAVEFLEKHIPAVRKLAYFAHMPAMLYGHPITLSRTGYTGERGYEIFCRGQDAGHIWDSILSEGAAMGIIPCRFTTLDMLRTESYLVFFPYDNSEMYPFADEAPGDITFVGGNAVATIRAGLCTNCRSFFGNTDTTQRRSVSLRGNHTGNFFGLAPGDMVTEYQQCQHQQDFDT